MITNDKAQSVIMANARMIWQSVSGDLAEAFIRLGMCKADLHTLDDIRFWQEVEREVVHIARKEGFFGRTFDS